MKIFLIRGGKCAGPFKAGELRQKISNGGVSPDELAWCAELTDWTNLEQVLAKTDEWSASGEADSFDRSGQSPPPLPESSLREKTVKLRPPSLSSSGGSGQYDAPVQAIPDAGEKQREAKRTGAMASGRPNAFGFLRWIGVLAAVVFLLTAFMPWVRTSTSAGRTEFSTVKMVMAKSSEVQLPGQNVPPKYFYLTKMILIGTLILVLLVALISLSNILSRDAETSGLGIMLSVVLLAGLIFMGVVYDHFFEREFNDALSKAITGGEPQSVSFKMDYGFYFALAAVVLMAGCLMIPKIVFGRLGPAMVPVSVAALFAVGLVGFGVLRMGSRNALQEVSSGVKEVLPMPSADNEDTGSVVPEPEQE
jgi:hypothetical protein